MLQSKEHVQTPLDSGRPHHDHLLAQVFCSHQPVVAAQHMNLV